MSVSSSSESKIIKPPRSLLLKHEILSPECDLFRVCLPRRLFAKRLGRIILFVLLVGVGHWWMKVEQLALTGLIIAVVLLIISFILSQAIEGKKNKRVIHCLTVFRKNSIYSWIGCPVQRHKRLQPGNHQFLPFRTN